MKDIDELELSAYIDGELDPVSSAALEERIATDDELRRRIDNLRRVNAAARAAFHYALYPSEESEPHTAVSAPVAVSKEPRQRQSGNWRQTLAMAASMATFFVLGAATVGWWDQQESVDARSTGLASWANQLEQNRIFQEVLETRPSGYIHTWPQATDAIGQQFGPVKTYQTASGAFCRQFTLAVAGHRERGVACRGDEGTWKVKVYYVQGVDA
jgi:surface antigen